MTPMPTMDPSPAEPTALATAPGPTQRAIDLALARVAPLWPLSHFVATNPFVGLAGLPFREACTLLLRTVGAMPLQSREDYRRAYDAGHIERRDLESVAGPWSADGLIAFVQGAHGTDRVAPLPTVADFLDAARPHAHWANVVVEEVSKWCAVYFDENQTTWQCPWRGGGLFAGWREAAAIDRNPETRGLTGFRRFVATLPPDSGAAIETCLGRLAPPHADPADFLHRQLATVAGWAGYAAYLVREDALRGKSSALLQDLLAIRLAYDAALWEGPGGNGGVRESWRSQRAVSPDPKAIDALARWQAAFERGYVRRLASDLAAVGVPRVTPRPDLQAIFCIDVRSEVFRRHLEAAHPGTQTVGFAGFFGFAVAHTPAGMDRPGSRCPVLLVPGLESCEPLPPRDAAKALSNRRAAGAWKAFQNAATSCFSFVESSGIGFAAMLARPSGHARPQCSRTAPQFADLPARTRADLAERALRSMSLTRQFARLVLVCGHGGESANNPYASSLDCGACGGHAGDVNARLAARVFNDPEVRAALAGRGITIPPDTVFVAGLHNTTTDAVEVFDVGGVPSSHAGDLRSLRAALEAAGRGARAERAPSLGMQPSTAPRLERAVRRRADDIAQVMPEWGLANNAAFVAGPRAITAGLNLGGRVFLHDYEAAQDTDRKVLELILCAPVVVASWINLQYYASRLDQAHYGAGTKVLHNIVGGIGALEGNGGDLKSGLPLQSVHDGTGFVHEPRRLSVFIAAQRADIDSVLRAHPEVRQLFDHEWLGLFSLEGNEVFGYHASGWAPLFE